MITKQSYEDKYNEWIENIGENPAEFEKALETAILTNNARIRREALEGKTLKDYQEKYFYDDTSSILYISCRLNHIALQTGEYLTTEERTMSLKFALELYDRLHNAPKQIDKIEDYRKILYEVIEENDKRS